MPDLDEFLREEFHAAVVGLTRTPELDARVEGHVRRARVRQRRAARLAALALVVAAVAPVAWLASRSSGPATSDVDAGSLADGLSPDDPALAGVTYLEPESLPDGLQLGLAAGGLRPGVPTWDRYQWIDTGVAGGETSRIVVRERSLMPGDPDPLALLGRSGTPTTVGGLQALASPTGEWLAWVDPQGVFHLLTRPAPAPPNPDAALLELHAVADGSLPVQPPGAPGPGPRLVDAVPAGSGDSNPRAMWFSDGAGRELTINVADASIPPIRPALAAGEGTAVRVRNRDAVLAPTTASRYDPLVVGLIPAPDWSLDHDPPTALTWMESDGVAVTLVGRGLSDDELVNVAESLRRVDAETWASHLGAPQPPVTEVSVVPPATVASPIETPVPPETEATLPPPPPGAQHLVGSSVGTERWHPTTGGCPTLDHQTDETVTMADGSVWAYHGEHCGELDDSQVHWRGGGSVTLTSPNGDTLTGTWSLDWIAIPSSRVQLLVTITGGTGAYAGASGACLADEGMTMGVFAVDGNSFHQGTITCDVAV